MVFPDNDSISPDMFHVKHCTDPYYATADDDDLCLCIQNSTQQDFDGPLSGLMKLKGMS